MNFGLDFNWTVIIVLFLLFDAFVLWYVFVKKRKNKIPEQKRMYYLKIWRSLGQKSHKEAIMEADKILDKLLEHRGYSGSLGDKLKRADAIFTDVNSVWEAHKLRNRLAHELGFHVSPEMAKRALKSFEKAYKDLGLFS
ncbi:hypothetical protein IT413_02435 [Candidatus Peregrinibacteria bacterium]|nr:hypothetical protein [Candidatus Peregrinibacteria bacterium]